MSVLGGCWGMLGQHWCACAGRAFSSGMPARTQCMYRDRQEPAHVRTPTRARGHVLRACVYTYNTQARYEGCGTHARA